MMVENKSGTALDFDATVNYMDNILIDRINGRIAPCTEQEFFSIYEIEHQEKYGTEWELSKPNPIW